MTKDPDPMQGAGVPGQHPEQITPHEWAHLFFMLAGCKCEMCKRMSEKLLKIRASHSTQPDIAGAVQEKFLISFDALMGIHRELTNINNQTSHIQDLLTPIQTSLKEHDAAKAQAAVDKVLEKLETMKMPERFSCENKMLRQRNATIEEMIESLRENPAVQPDNPEQAPEDRV